MDIASIDEEFKRIRAQIDEGASLLEKQKHEEAQKVLFEALKQIEALEFPLPADRIECLLKLGDAYFGQKRYIEAQAVYKQLRAVLSAFDEEIDAQEKSVILFKLAKSTDKVQDFDFAKELFRDLIEVAESCMQPGEPLLTEMYEAYSSLLRRAKLEPALLKELEKKSRFSRQRQSGVIDALFDEKDAERKKKRRLEEEEALRQLSPPQQLLKRAKVHPRLALLIVSSPVLVAFFLLVTVATLAAFGIDVGATFPLKVSDRYSTIDGGIQLKVLSKDRVQVTSARTFEMDVRTMNGWSELVESVRRQRHQYWLQNKGDLLLGQDGLILHKATADSMKIRDAMQLLGRALEESAKQNHNFNPRVDNLIESGLLKVDERTQGISFASFTHSGSMLKRNPQQGKNKSRITVVRLNDRTFLEQATTFTSRDFERHPDIEELRQRLPILVVAISHGKACAIFALDGSNTALKTNDGSKNQILSTINASVMPFTINEPVSRIPEIVGKKTLLVAQRSRVQVLEKYYHVLSAFIILLVLIPAGVMLYKQWNREMPKFDYYNPPDRTHEVMACCFFVLVCLFYLGYVAWIVLT